MSNQLLSDIWTNEDNKVLTSSQSYASRLNEVYSFINVRNAIRNSSKSDEMTYQEALNGKKLFADAKRTKIERLRSTYAMLAKGNNATADLLNSTKYQQISDDLVLKTQLKYLQLYYDSYMSEQKSDLQWRLGNIKAYISDPEIEDEISGTIKDGRIYTRADASPKAEWDYISRLNPCRKQKFYTAMYFPPYKVGAKSKITDEGEDPEDTIEPSFRTSDFTIKRENFTYRDAGMKLLSDYINFLQEVAEGATGIVSTYLTEWDLSVYMQEGLMTPKVNGGPMNIYLNYRIHEDNPLADVDSNSYLDDTALAFNVAGSSVSKLFYDCTKIWRPSDYPSSVWWTPYLLGSDYTLKYLDLTSTLNQKIPYMSFYDDVKSNYSYKSNSLKDILMHQDFIGFIAAAKNRLDGLHYYDAFYRSEDDALSDMDIKMNNLMNAVAGSDYGVSTAQGKDLDYLIFTGRKEMLMNGGYYGAPQSVSSGGGYLGRMAIDIAMQGGDSSEQTGSSMLSKAAASGSDSYDQSAETTNEDARKSADGFLDSKKDSSIMSDLTGINRWSPAIYGGPHGRDFSLNHLRGYYQADSTIARNIVRAAPYIVDDSADLTKVDKPGVESNYKPSDEDVIDFSQSPVTVISNLKEGAYSYETKLGYVLRQIEDDFEGVYKLSPDGTVAAEFPKTCNGKPVVFLDDQVSTRNKVITMQTRVFKKMPYDKRYFYEKLKGTSIPSYAVYTKKVPIRRAKVYRLVETAVKYYFLEDQPNMKWSIVAHNFESFTMTSDALYSISRQSLGTKSKINYIKSANPATVLVLNSQAEEKQFIRNIIRYNRGITDLPRYMWFFADKNGKLTYVFKAPCYVRYYKNSTKVYVKTMFGKKSYAGTQYTFMPFIYVDLSAVSQFYDLSAKIISYDNITGENVPIHINNYLAMHVSNDISNPIQAMSKMYSHTITAYENKKTESAGFFSSLTTVLFGAEAKHTYQNLGWGVVKWRNTANLGISGTGILSGWPGIEPSCDEEITFVDSTNPLNPVEYKISQCEYVKRSTGAGYKDVPVANLPMFCVQKSNDISRLVTLMNLDYKLEGAIGAQTYQKVAMPQRIANAINKVNIMLKFYSYGLDAPNYYDLAVPYINFLSFCFTERNYLRQMLDIVKTVEFKSLRKLLFNNIDSCVLKACGVQKTVKKVGDIETIEYPRVKADPKHVLYDYWIDAAVQMLYDESELDKKQKEVIDKFEQLISSISSTVDNVTAIIKKGSTAFTYNDLKNLNYEIYLQQQNTNERSVIDEFVFMYLHILYQYRLYFIGKRFNKKDGTMWIMRALESTIDLVAQNIDPAKDPSVLDNEQNSYAVAFYEIQNSLDLKRTALIDEDHEPLEVDKICKIYVQVEYGSESDYNAWIAYKNNPNELTEVREVIRLVLNDKEVRYVFKPKDGLYQFRSKEFDNNYKNDMWNQYHKNQEARAVVDYFNCVTDITWKPTKECTPIRFNVFGSIDTNNLLVYSQDSLSAEDLLCLTEKGADFWTITLPPNMRPETELYKTGLYIAMVEKTSNASSTPTTDTVFGPFANVLSPIVDYKFNISAGISTELLNNYGISI